MQATRMRLDVVSLAPEAFAPLLGLGVIDRIVREPVGGAHRDPAAACATLGKAITEEIDALVGKSADELRNLRAERFLRIGA
mgnify:CR=1 FL=1